MNYYGAKELAAAFRTVRGNTIKIAEEIPEDKYSFKASSESRTVAQTLTHMANATKFPMHMHGEKKLNTLVGFDFMAFIGPLLADEQKSRTKAEIIDLLKANGEEYAKMLETMPESAFAEVITFPQGAEPPSKTRFEMLLGPKEHEMHHRGQLTTILRMIGQVPHLTRAQQERFAAMQAAQAAKS